MSTMFRMSATVSKLKKKEIPLVKEALSGWDWDVTDQKDSIFAHGDMSLGGGMDDQEMAHNVRDAVWEITKRFVPIEMSAACLEHIPTEYYEFTEDDYEEKEEE